MCARQGGAGRGGSPAPNVSNVATGAPPAPSLVAFLLPASLRPHCGVLPSCPPLGSAGVGP